MSRRFFINFYGLCTIVNVFTFFSLSSQQNYAATLFAFIMSVWCGFAFTYYLAKQEPKS